ncbi:Composite domain of metallo-dependent hydrolases protein [Dioscorea alata]|uniref:Composite domain of metallo-dependent hydrolases protein n=1 Tax=Dioscorea alata TaxID=55571 RepID=A0ACB7UHC3_DIOAL|nr:Composite domain of metallo-dependent hydrolases protein [Dioscorea alata]
MVAPPPSSSSISAPLLLYNGVIFTMDPHSCVFRNSAIVVSGDRIHIIGRSNDILRDFYHLVDGFIDLSGSILLPGPSVFPLSSSISSESRLMIDSGGLGFVDCIWDV